MSWVKSSFCASGSCVEVNIGNTDVAIRDTHGTERTVDTKQWADLIARIKASEYDV